MDTFQFDTLRYKLDQIILLLRELNQNMQSDTETDENEEQRGKTNVNIKRRTE